MLTMTEMKIISGKHECGKTLDIRISNNKNDIKKDSRIKPFWIIYGVCKHCKIIIMEDVFFTMDEPKLDVDFIIDYDKIVKTTKHLNFNKNLKK